MIIDALYMNVLLDSFAKFYGPRNRIRKKGKFDSFPFSLFIICTVEILISTPLCLEVKVIMNVLYTNLLLHSFAKFYEPETRIKKKKKE